MIRVVALISAMTATAIHVPKRGRSRRLIEFRRDRLAAVFLFVQLAMARLVANDDDCVRRDAPFRTRLGNNGQRSNFALDC